MKLLGIIRVDFDITDQLLIRYSACHILKKWEYKRTLHHLFMNLKKDYDSVRREAPNNNPPESGIPIKLLRLIKMFK
jgi:hypothetical protein